MAGQSRTLKSRALLLLAQRDQSRVELRRKLLVHALRDGECERPGTSIHADRGAAETVDADAGDAAARVEAVLVWLEANRFLSDERFAESRVHARASRYGNLRIRQELKQHGVALSDDTAQALRETEQARAVAVWERRFGQWPQTAAESAKQARFLTSRGFSPDTVGRILRKSRAGAAALDEPTTRDD